MEGERCSGVCGGGGGGGSVEMRCEQTGRPANEAEVKMYAEFPVYRHLTKITQPHQVER